MALLIAASLGAGILLTKLLRDQQQREAATNTETEADRHVLEYEGMDIAGGPSRPRPCSYRIRRSY